MKGAEWTCGVVLSASLSDVPKLIAVVALGEPVGGDDRGDLSGVGEEANRGVHGVDVLWSDRYGNGGGEFTLSGSVVGVEKPGEEDGNASCIPDRGSQSIKEVVAITGLRQW